MKSQTIYGQWMGTLGAFWLWLTSFLFRPQQVEPTAERFQLAFGSWSPLYSEGMASLKRAWAAVSGASEAKLASRLGNGTSRSFTVSFLNFREPNWEVLCGGALYA